MNAQSPKKMQLVLANEEEAGRIVVDLDAFLEFNRAVKQSLRNLESKWAHVAAPAAAQPRGAWRRRRVR